MFSLPEFDSLPTRLISPHLVPDTEVAPNVLLIHRDDVALVIFDEASIPDIRRASDLSTSSIGSPNWAPMMAPSTATTKARASAFAERDDAGSNLRIAAPISCL